MFSAEEWPRASALLDAALDLPPAERAALLDAECGGDTALRARIDAMLAACEEVAPALERPVAEVAAALVGEAGRAEPADHLEGRRLGAYRLVRALGEGGMGAVYLAERADDQYRKQVAIKLIRGAVTSRELRERFRTERQILAQLEHPNIARLLDGGVADETFAPGAAGLPYLVMEYVVGEPIDEYCDRKQLSIRDRVRLFCSVCAAVQYAHSQHVVHRDLKPSNILVTETDQGMGPSATVKLLDFGIAKLVDESAADGMTDAARPLTRTGMQVMTPEYASPEQVCGEQVTPASDVYSLGVVLCELLAGRRPYVLATHSATEMHRVVLAGDPQKPSALVDAGDKRHRMLRGDLDAIVLKALRKEPDQRYATAEELRQDLERYLDGRPVTAHAGAWTYRATKLLRRHRALIGGASAVLAIAAAAFVWGRGRATGAAVPAGGRAVTVLPFVNVGGDTATEYFADGITEELIGALTKLPSLRVTPRSSAFTFKGRVVDVREVGRLLGSGAVVEGSVRRAGGKLRVSAQIVDVASNANIWSERYDRDATDVFQVQDELSAAIARALRAKLGGAAPAAATRGTSDPEAYDLFMQGRYFANRFTKDDLRRGIALYEKAIARDSSFARPWAAIAIAWMGLADDWYAPREAYPKAEAAARRALALDPTLAEAHAALGGVLSFYDWDHAAAVRELRRALELDPRSVEAHIIMTLVQAALGNADSVAAHARAAVTIDPLSAVAHAVAGRSYYAMRRYDDEIAEMRRQIELTGASESQAASLFLAARYGRRTEIADSLARTVCPSPPPAPCRESSMLAWLVRRDTAAIRRRAAAVIRRGEREYVNYIGPAMIKLAAGDTAGVIDLLEMAYQQRNSGVPMIRRLEAYDPLRGDPRFQELVRKVNLGGVRPK